MAELSLTCDTNKTDVEIYQAVWAWFGNRESYFTSPFVKRVELEEEAEGIKVTIREEMPLGLGFTMPMVARAKITGDPAKLEITSRTRMNGYEHVTVLVSFARNGGKVELKERLDFELGRWIGMVPGVNRAMTMVTKKAWLKAHRNVIQSMGKQIAKL
ncbi:hypothetical protein BASA81_000278 [Batrachochytrium salamandrivorans]|nr:hypothetical protein BASA81_000278 [Batrachochytrium salamandrivorans]